MKLPFLKFALVAFLFLASISNALAVYRCTVNGQTVFQDSPCLGSLGTVAEDAQRRAKQKEVENDRFLQHSLATNAMSPEERSQQPKLLEAQAKARITERMIDPKSTEFRNVKAYIGVAARNFYSVEDASGPPVIDVVCGEVNSKNRMGGYVGFKPFYWTRDGKVALPESDNFEKVLSTLVIRSCAKLER
ncbi:hypothetical protein SAMN05216344_11416 [Polaromonas sp. OV174]|uniref:DUF4124 domain-containing protein n=1 Tax=Polaromonas sp. OV174 TaxID=1855300 RepID=UPI0008E9AC42|nr:DUF4124 domain-containing protein [Polaromonas sp. OV174]SFC32519.1 hypothetical protein SAMN05216344_11416 [Polaromonas sp. OV174]